MGRDGRGDAGVGGGAVAPADVHGQMKGRLTELIGGQLVVDEAAVGDDLYEFGPAGGGGHAEREHPPVPYGQTGTAPDLREEVVDGLAGEGLTGVRDGRAEARSVDPVHHLQPQPVQIVTGRGGALAALQGVAGVRTRDVDQRDLDAERRSEVPGGVQVLGHQRLHLRTDSVRQRAVGAVHAQQLEQGPALGVGGVDHLGEPGRVHARGACQRSGLRDGAPAAVRDHIAGDLGGHPGAERTAVHDLPGPVVEYGQRRVHRGPVAADDRDHAVLGRPVAGRHPAVQEADTAGRAQRGQLVDDRQGDGGEQHDGQARMGARQQPVLPADHFARLTGVDDGDHHHIAAPGHLGGRGQRIRDSGQVRRGIRPDVVNQRGPAAPRHADGDPAADHAEPHHACPQGLLVRHTASPPGKGAQSATSARYPRVARGMFTPAAPQTRPSFAYSATSRRSARPPSAIRTSSASRVRP